MNRLERMIYGKPTRTIRSMLNKPENRPTRTLTNMLEYANVKRTEELYMTKRFKTFIETSYEQPFVYGFNEVKYD